MSKLVETLSKQQARKLVLLSQQVLPTKQTASALASTLSAIEHLGYIQIDTISAVQRAHHHTLWNRNPNYAPSQLDQLLADKKVFEYWSHAAAYLPMSKFRYSLPRKNALASGNEKHWWKPDEKLMNWVLKRLENEGPLMGKDFESGKSNSKEWTTSTIKQGLGNLFMQGDIMIAERVKFHKIFDLTERVLPKDIDTSIPNEDEYARFLIIQFLKANGLGQASEVAYLLKNTKALIAKNIAEMHAKGEIVQIDTCGNTYFALPDSLELLNKTLPRNKIKILSPFDNLLIQRKRMQALFDYDYQIECYVPEAKRKFGYFSLPILWNGTLVARMDCKVDRKKTLLHINHLALEDKLLKTDDFAVALVKELVHFMKFNNCSDVILHKTTPTKFKDHLQKVLSTLIKE